MTGSQDTAARPERRWRSGLVAALPLVLLATLERPALVRERLPTSRPNDLAAVARVVADGARPGDGVLFLPARTRAAGISYLVAFERTQDVTLAESGVRSGTLRGVVLPVRTARADLLRHPRVWWIGRPGLVLRDDERYGRALRATLLRHFTLGRRYDVKGAAIGLYVRR